MEMTLATYFPLRNILVLLVCAIDFVSYFRRRQYAGVRMTCVVELTEAEHQGFQQLRLNHKHHRKGRIPCQA